MVTETRGRPSGVRIRRRSVEDGIRLYERYTRRFERCYGRTSAAMAEAVASGEADCTPEVSLWLHGYRTLQSLRGLAGRTDGATTTST